MTDGWQLIAAERAALAGDLEHLDAAAWRTASLCEGLTVEEVLAHLTAGASLAFPRWFAGVVRCRFDFDRMVVMRLREQLAPTPDETLQRFRRVVDSRAAPNRRDVDAWLGEVVVHGEDIRRPLGLHRDHPTEVLLRVAAFYARRDLTVPSRRRAAGLRLAATDAPLAVGQGPAVEGRAIDLVLAMAGRTDALAHLTGPGVPTLAARAAEPSGRVRRAA